MGVTVDKITGKVLLHKHTIDDIKTSNIPDANKVLYGDGSWKTPASAIDEKVKASSNDTTAGYLSDKVDNLTIEVANEKLQVKSGVFALSSHNHNLADLSEKSYNSLTDKPDLSQLHNRQHSLTSTSDHIPATGTDKGKFLKTNATTGNPELVSLATVAETGSYADLSNKPNIPTKTSDLTNDSGFISSESDPVWASEKSGYFNKTNDDLDDIAEGTTNKHLTAALKSQYDTAYVHSQSSHPFGNVGTKEVDETNIANQKILQYNSTSGKLEYVDKPSGAVWGSITGTLSNQTDLQTALDGKASTSHNHNLADLAEKSYNSLTDKPTIPTSHTQLTDIGINTHAQIDNFISSKGQANGLASLDASSKVVQDPVNATPTPTASKIPIADGSGKLDGWVSDASTSTKGKVQLATDGENVSGKVVQANDTRLSNSRTPTSHASTHQHGGSDEVATATPTPNAIPKANASGKLDSWITVGSSIEETDLNFSDVTTANASTSKHGLLPKLSGISTQYLDGTGAWSTPAGGGGDNITVNGVSVVDADFNDVTPSAPSGGVNVLWQKDSSSPANISAYLPVGSSFIDALRLKPFYYTDFLGAAGATTEEAAYPFDFAVISSGTQAKIAGEANHPGILRISSSTTANSGGYVLTDTTAFLLGGGECFELIFQHRVASGTNTTIRFGYLDTTTSTDATDGVYFEVPAGSLNLRGKTASNSTRSTTGTSYTLTVNTWYRARLVVNSNATRVDFYLYDSSGTLLWTDFLTTNIPTASGRNTGAGVIATNAGTTATLLCYLDWMAIWFEGRTLTG